MPNTPIHILLPEDLRPVQSLEDYRSRGGLVGLDKAYKMSRQQVIDEIKNAGLRGRGGAGFPTAIKWQGINQDPSPRKYIVCNGSEGEPGTYKDRYLLQKNPYPLLEGILIGAYAVEATAAFIGIKGKFKREVARLTQALLEMEKANIAPHGYITIVPGPDDYLFGEERALLEVIDGRGAMPRVLPTYLQGVGFTPTEYNPTVVNNVETFNHAAHIMARGADWFKAIGAKDCPGTMIFTLSGDVKRPGMYELPMGTTLRTLLYEYGGGPIDKPIKAVFSGVANNAITPDMFDTPLDFVSMRAAGSGLGSGGFIVYDETNCMVKVAANFSRFLAIESCGQCVPCKRGSKVITEHLDKIEQGMGTTEDLENIMIECGMVTNQTRCFLSNEEAIIVSSILKKFRSEFEEHLWKHCPHPRQPILGKISDFNEETHTFSFEDAKAFVTV